MLYFVQWQGYICKEYTAARKLTAMSLAMTVCGEIVCTVAMQKSAIVVVHVLGSWLS